MTPIPGEAGVDYPVFNSVPDTGFDCASQDTPGIYTDTQAQCQVDINLIYCFIFLRHQHDFSIFISVLLHVQPQWGILRFLVSQWNHLQPAVLRVRLVVQH